MMPDKIDHRDLRSLTDVRIAREKLRFGLSLQEQIITSGFSRLGIP